MGETCVRNIVEKYHGGWKKLRKFHIQTIFLVPIPVVRFVSKWYLGYSMKIMFFAHRIV